MKKSFLDFLTARDILVGQTTNNPTSSIKYKINKYTKFPTINENVETLICVKPKEIIEVLWEFDTNGNVVDIRQIKINENIYYYPNDTRSLRKWLNTNTLIDSNNWFV